MAKEITRLQYETTESRLFYTGGNHVFTEGEHTLVITHLNESVKPDTEFVLKTTLPFSTTLLLNPYAIMVDDRIIHIGEPREINVVQEAYEAIMFEDYIWAKVVFE